MTPAPAPWRRRFLAPARSFPTWARDQGGRLVYSSDESGKREVYVWDLAGGRRCQLTDRPEGTPGAQIDAAGLTVWWLDDKGGDERGRWRRQPFAGGSAIPVAELPPGYASGLLAGARATVVGITDERGSAVNLLDREGQGRVLYRHREQAWAAALSRDETLLAIEHSERGDARNPAVRVLDLAGEALAEIDDGPGRGVEAIAWSPVPGDDRLLLSQERDGFSRPLIWQQGRGQRQEVEVDLPGDVLAAWYPDAASLLLTHRHRGRSELHRLDLGTARLTRLELPAGWISAARVRPDGELWFQWTDAAHPAEMRSAGGPLLPEEWEPAPPGVPYRDLLAGGVHAFLAEPPRPRPHPTVFYVHGGPESLVTDAFSPPIQAFVDHGFAVVAVNYRGSTGYGKAWRDALVGRPGLTELEDLAAVYDQVVREGIADPRRMVLHGRSWGGYLTLLGLGVQPERWALGLAGVPVADYVAAFEDEMEPLQAYDRALFGGTPREVPDVYVQRSPITYVERVRAPVLILAGEHDPRCPIRQIDNYLARLRDLGKVHETHRYDAGHSSLRMAETLRQMELMLDFCARHLGTPPPA